MFLHNAHGTMISGSSFMIDNRFATYSSLVQIHTLQNRQNHGRAAIQKFVYNVTKRVLMQLQSKIWKETSAGSYNLLNVKIVGLLFTTGNFYCLLTRLQFKSVKMLVVSTCASPIGLS